MDKNKPLKGETHINDSVLSIRLTRDGQYFSASDGTTASAPEAIAYDGVNRVGERLKQIFGDRLDFGSVEIIAAVAKTALVPGEAAKSIEGDAGKFFALSSCKIKQGDNIISFDSGDKTLFAVLDEKPVAEIRSLFPGKEITLTHPIIKGLEYDNGNRQVLLVYITHEASFYVIKSGKKLLCADSLPVADFPAVLLNINRLIVANKLGRTGIICGGDNKYETAEKLGEYFPEVSAYE